MANPATLRRGGNSPAQQRRMVQAAVEARVAVKAVRGIALRLLKRPLYQQQLKKALDEGTLHPTIHALLYHYAYGKPKEELEVSQPVPVRIQHVYGEATPAKRSDAST